MFHLRPSFQTEGMRTIDMHTIERSARPLGTFTPRNRVISLTSRAQITSPATRLSAPYMA
jgi:hypothetical protein